MPLGLEAIDAEPDRLGALVAALLDMSRLHAGTLAVHLEPVGLEPVGLDEMVSRRSSLPSPPLHRGRLGCEEATSPP